jgi:Tfp pilus assembly protein PilV
MTPRSSSGFGLIELMVALGVLSVGVIALAAVFPLGLNRVGDAGQQTRASELATQAAEQLLATPYPDEDLDPGPHVDPANPHAGIYHVKWSVEDDQPITSCKRVTITVHHPSATSTPRVRLVVVIARAGAS